MIDIVDDAFDYIARCQRGDGPQSLPSGYPKYDDDVGGINQGEYILVGGETGTGKSRFIRSTYVHNIYEEYRRINDDSILDVQFIDFSLELTARANVLNATSRRIYLDHGIVIEKKRMERKRGTIPLTDEENAIVNSYRDHFKPLYSKLSVVTGTVSPAAFHDTLMRVAVMNGRFSTYNPNDIDLCEGWVPNNPNKFIIVLFDTLNLVGSSMTKILMDDISGIAIKFRNKCNFTFVIVQQFNSDLASTDRSRFGINTPILKDFKDSTRPTNDADVVIGLYAPYKHFKADNPIFKGYDVSKMGRWLITLHVMKSRDGIPNACIPMKFNGAVGIFSELPPYLMMTDEEYRKATTY